METFLKEYFFEIIKKFLRRSNWFIFNINLKSLNFIFKKPNKAFFHP